MMIHTITQGFRPERERSELEQRQRTAGQRLHSLFEHEANHHSSLERVELTTRLREGGKTVMRPAVVNPWHKIDTRFGTREFRTVRVERLLGRFTNFEALQIKTAIDTGGVDLLRVDQHYHTVDPYGWDWRPPQPPILDDLEPILQGLQVAIGEPNLGFEGADSHE